MRRKMTRWLPGALALLLAVCSPAKALAGLPYGEGTAGSVSWADFPQAVSSGGGMGMSENGISMPARDEAGNVSGNGIPYPAEEAPAGEGSGGITDGAGADGAATDEAAIDGIGVDGAGADEAGTDGICADGNGADEAPMLLDAGLPWTFESTGIAFTRQYQAFMENSNGQYYCVDFDECPAGECDILFGSKYAAASAMDIYTYSNYSSS